MRMILMIAALLVACSGFAQAADDAGAPVVARVTDLLVAYSAKDVPAVMHMLDPQAAMYGTAASEFFTTPAGVEGLLRSDYRQWSSASFGAPQNVTMQESGDIESVFFDAPFTATFNDGKQRSFTIRFATVWKHVRDRWLLVQSMNAVVN